MIPSQPMLYHAYDLSCIINVYSVGNHDVLLTSNIEHCNWRPGNLSDTISHETPSLMTPRHHQYLSLNTIFVFVGCPPQYRNPVNVRGDRLLPYRKHPHPQSTPLNKTHFKTTHTYKNELHTIQAKKNSFSYII